MKQYLLLRDNRESGPYSFEEMATMGLRRLDLIWIDGESTGWNHPSEIENLGALVIHEHKAPATEKHLSAENKQPVFVALPSRAPEKQQEQIREEYSTFPLHETESPEIPFAPLDEIKENYQELPSKTIWNRRMVPSSKLMGLAGVFAGVILGAFVIKKMVDGFVPEANEEAAATILSSDPVPALTNDNFKNALSTEIVPAAEVPVRTLPKKRLPALEGQLKLKTNDYKVGLFGGINGLQLTVFNTSSLFVDKIIVGVDYLKPGGSVVQSENISFSSIRPKASQTIPIPGSRRGVKIHYKILKVYSHEYKAALREA